jgi:hypothetical protein
MNSITVGIHPITSESGIALERINLTFGIPGFKLDIGSCFGRTPGYKNSESFPAGNPDSDLISVEPKIFSPDQDGYQVSCLSINYPCGIYGHFGYDILGRVVRKLVNILWNQRKFSLGWA